MVGASAIRIQGEKVLSHIFVSYRRSDAAGHCGRLVDELEKAFPRSKIFRDLDSIEAGTDFVDAIEAAVGDSVVLLAIIGSRWLTVTNAAGARRLDLADDFVRLEIASALRAKIRVIPVLVDGALPFGLQDLPGDIAGLARLQIHELSERRWDYDVEQLIEILKRIPSLAPASTGSTPPISKRSTGSSRRQLALAVSALVALVAFTLGVVFYLRGPAQANQAATPDSSQNHALEPKPAVVARPTPLKLAENTALSAHAAPAAPAVHLTVVRNARASDGGWPVYAKLEDVGRNAAARLCKVFGGAEISATCLRSRAQRVSLVLRIESTACNGYVSSDAFVEDNMLPQRKLNLLPSCP